MLSYIILFLCGMFVMLLFCLCCVYVMWGYYLWYVHVNVYVSLFYVLLCLSCVLILYVNVSYTLR